MAQMLPAECLQTDTPESQWEEDVRHAFELQKVQFLDQFDALEQLILNCTSAFNLEASGPSYPAVSALDDSVSDIVDEETKKGLDADKKRPDDAKVTFQPTPSREFKLRFHKHEDLTWKSFRLTPTAHTTREQRQVGCAEQFQKLLHPRADAWKSFIHELRVKTGLTKSSRARVFEVYLSRACVPALLKSVAKRFLENHLVANGIICIILANAVIMAMEADAVMKKTMAHALQSDRTLIQEPRGHYDDLDWYKYSDWFFAAVYTLELICRLLVHELECFFGEDAAWNALDGFVVVFAWIELIASDAKPVGEVHFLRLWRLVRVVRSLRVIRSLRFFMQLRLLVVTLMHSVKPLLWCTLSLILFIFMFTNVFLQLLAVSLGTYRPDSIREDDWPQILIPMFGSFGDGMISLLAVVLGGMEWELPYKALAQVSSHAAALFLFYLVLVILGVLNMISAIFVEGALSKAKSDHYLQLVGQQEARKEFARELMYVYRSIDVDGSGGISGHQWKSFLKTEEGQNFLLLFNMEFHQARRLFEILDFEDYEQLSVEEFVVGFLQLHGAVNKAELELTLLKSKKVSQMLKSHMSDSFSVWQKLLARLDKMQDLINQQNAHPSAKCKQSDPQCGHANDDTRFSM